MTGPKLPFLPLKNSSLSSDTFLATEIIKKNWKFKYLISTTYMTSSNLLVNNLTNTIAQYTEEAFQVKRFSSSTYTHL